MKRLAWMLLIALLIPMNAWAQEEVDVGPRVIAEIGVEKPFNANLDVDLLMRWGAGIEWPGVFGYEDVWFVGSFQQIGWGTDAVEVSNRWNWGLKTYPDSYWTRVNPWIAAGVEHDGGHFLVDQTNVTWLGIGIEPRTPVGWVQISWQATGWAMSDREERYRFVVGLVPADLLE